jgi:chaperonin GroES
MFAKPNGRFIIAKKIEVEKENVTKSGLYVAANQGDNNLPRAEVLAVGDGYLGPDGTLHPLPVNVGDIVMYGFNCDIPFQHNEENYVVINCDHVMAIINESV